MVGTMPQKFNPSILEDLHRRPITRLHWGHVISLHPSAVFMEIYLSTNDGYYVPEIQPLYFRRLIWVTNHKTPLRSRDTSPSISGLHGDCLSYVGGYYVFSNIPYSIKGCMDGSSCPRNVAYKLEEMYGILGWSRDIQRIFQQILPWITSLLHVTWLQNNQSECSIPFLCPYMVLAGPLSQNPYFTSTFSSCCFTSVTSYS